MAQLYMQLPSGCSTCFDIDPGTPYLQIRQHMPDEKVTFGNLPRGGPLRSSYERDVYFHRERWLFNE